MARALAVASLMRTATCSTPGVDSSAQGPGVSASARAQSAEIQFLLRTRTRREPTRIAGEGTRGRGGPLPHAGRIQESFGPHDVTPIEAFIGGDAATAAARLGASAYASGERVAFREAPNLRTAAHEAAHVIQQRAGLALPDGLGRSGDRYERQATAVADRVASGHSAADLLPERQPDEIPDGGEARAVQRIVDRDVIARAVDIQDYLRWLIDVIPHSMTSEEALPALRAARTTYDAWSAGLAADDISDAAIDALEAFFWNNFTTLPGVIRDARPDAVFLIQDFFEVHGRETPPVFAQVGPTCAPASILSALLIWNSQDPNAGSPLVERALESYLAYVEDHRSELGGGRLDIDDVVHRIYEYIGLLGEGFPLAERDYQYIAAAFYETFNVSEEGFSTEEMTALLEGLGSLTEVWAQPIQRADQIWSAAAALIRGQILSVGWYRVNAQGLPESHAFLVGRLFSGEFFISDTAGGDYAHAATWEGLRSQIGETWIWTGTRAEATDATRIAGGPTLLRLLHPEWPG